MALQDLNSQAQTATIDVNVQLWYINKDAEGLEGDPEKWPEEDKSKIWKPIIDFYGNVDLEEKLPDGGSFYVREQYSKYGICNWYQKYKGSVTVDLDLREFPFDRQLIKIKFGTTMWQADTVTLKNITTPEQINLFSVGMNLTEWDLVGHPQLVELREYLIEDKRDVSCMELSIPLRRKSEYYLTHIIFMVLLINVMSWTVYMCGNQLSNRLSLDMALFLALVALNFVVIGFIPKVSYGTKLSQYFVVSYFFITFDTIQNVVSSLISSYYCINGYDPWALNVVNGTLHVPESPVGPCNSATYFDWVSLLIVALSETLYTFFYIVLGRLPQPGETVIRQHYIDPAILPKRSDEEHVKID